jgi:hypothetical protein
MSLIWKHHTNNNMRQAKQAQKWNLGQHLKIWYN